MRNMEAELTTKETQRRQEVGALRAEMAQLELEVGTLREGGGSGRGDADEGVAVWKAQLTREQAQLEDDQKALQKISTAMNARLSLQLDLLTEAEEGGGGATSSMAESDPQELRRLQQQLQSVVGGNGQDSGSKAPRPASSRRRASQGGAADEASRLERKLIGTTDELRRSRAAQAEAEAKCRAQEQRFESFKQQSLERAGKQERVAQKELRKAQLQQQQAGRRSSGRAKS